MPDVESVDEVESADIHEAGLSLSLPDLVFETRVGADMSQAELATAIGASESNVAAWEDGSKSPDVGELQRVAQACGKRLHISIDVA
jgi:transcriptional regulator with XRE-family HTH domain